MDLPMNPGWFKFRKQVQKEQEPASGHGANDIPTAARLRPFPHPAPRDPAKTHFLPSDFGLHSPFVIRHSSFAHRPPPHYDSVTFFLPSNSGYGLVRLTTS